jgi:hypothetical protein
MYNSSGGMLLFARRRQCDETEFEECVDIVDAIPVDEKHKEFAVRQFAGHWVPHSGVTVTHCVATPTKHDCHQESDETIHVMDVVSSSEDDQIRVFSLMGEICVATQ